MHERVAVPNTQYGAETRYMTVAEKKRLKASCSLLSIVNLNLTL